MAFFKKLYSLSAFILNINDYIPSERYREIDVIITLFLRPRDTLRHIWIGWTDVESVSRIHGFWSRSKSTIATPCIAKEGAELNHPGNRGNIHRE